MSQRPPRRPRAGPRSEPTVGRGAEDLRRIERGEVRSVSVMLTLKRRPRRVDDEGRESQKHEQRLDPPDVAPHRFAKPRLGKPDRCTRYGHATYPPNMKRLRYWVSGPRCNSVCIRAALHRLGRQGT